ncbi:MAG: SMI1/KNR4 family protein [Flavobacteriales bacterium]|nr:SMI1/KNR4 family protein [Flavobacteriales bacterium]
MSPTNSMYLILLITAILVFLIVKYVKEPREEGSLSDETENEERFGSDEMVEERKTPVDFRDLDFQSSHQALSEDEYEAFIQEHQLNLPELYREIMLTANGGKPNKPFFRGGEVHFSSIKYGEYTLDAALWLAGEHFLPNGMFPFIDNGEYGYAISMNEDTLFHIYFWDETGEFIHACNSLQEFLNELDESAEY